jgi:hypothetical protein
MFSIKVREISLPEFFIRVYIKKHITRAIVNDMVTALRDGRAAGHARAFAPYVSTESRRSHRRDMRYLDLTRQFNYDQIKDQWIAAYENNIQAHKDRLAEMNFKQTRTFVQG